MKKLTTIVLLSLLLFQSSGVVMVLSGMQQWLQQKHWADLDDDEDQQLEELTLSLSSFKQSLINAHEIKWEGKLYDLHSVKRVGNIVKIQAVNDSKEASILDCIRKITENHSKSPTKNSLHLLNLMTVVYLPVQLPYFFSSPQQVKPCYQLLFENTLSANYNIWLPPPRLV